MPFGSASFGSCQQCIMECLLVQCVPVELIQNINVIEVSEEISGWLSSRKLVAPKGDNIQAVMYPERMPE